MEGYWSLLQTAGKVLKDADIDISREDYANGYMLFGCDLTSDMGKDDHFNLINRGSSRLSIKFGEALPQIVNVIIYAEFQNVLEIDRKKTCFTISLRKHEWTDDQTHLRQRYKDQGLFSRRILSKKIANCDTYDIAVRL